MRPHFVGLRDQREQPCLHGFPVLSQIDRANPDVVPVKAVGSVHLLPHRGVDEDAIARVAIRVSRLCSESETGCVVNLKRIVAQPSTPCNWSRSHPNVFHARLFPAGRVNRFQAEICDKTLLTLQNCRS